MAVEFGILAPILMLLATAGTDVVNFMRAQMRLDSAALQLGQLVSQCNRIATPGDTDQFWSYAQQVVGSLGIVTGTGANGAVIVSAIGRVGGNNQVAWQHRTGAVTHASRVGAAGGNAALNAGFAVPPGQTLFVTEVFLQRDAWPLSSVMMGGVTSRVLSGTTFFLTRAPDAPSLQLPPASRTQPDCTG